MRTPISRALALTMVFTLVLAGSALAIDKDLAAYFWNDSNRTPATKPIWPKNHTGEDSQRDFDLQYTVALGATGVATSTYHSRAINAQNAAGAISIWLALPNATTNGVSLSVVTGYDRSSTPSHVLPETGANVVIGKTTAALQHFLVSVPLCDSFALSITNLDSDAITVSECVVGVQ